MPVMSCSARTLIQPRLTTDIHCYDQPTRLMNDGDKIRQIRGRFIGHARCEHHSRVGFYARSVKGRRLRYRVVRPVPPREVLEPAQSSAKVFSTPSLHQYAVPSYGRRDRTHPRRHDRFLAPVRKSRHDPRGKLAARRRRGRATELRQEFFWDGLQSHTISSA